FLVVVHRRVEQRWQILDEIPPKAFELDIEGGELLRPGRHHRPRRVIHIVLALDPGGIQRLKETDDIPGADRHPGRPQPPPEPHQVAADDRLVDLGWIVVTHYRPP